MWTLIWEANIIMATNILQVVYLWYAVIYHASEIVVITLHCTLWLIIFNVFLCSNVQNEHWVDKKIDNRF
jgi:hypothetical protein